MLRIYHYGRKAFHFVNAAEIIPNKNIFTIIVGKNGTGKSRLLSSIVSEFVKIPRKITEGKLSAEDLDYSAELVYSGKAKIENDFIPSKIITSSTSPFDRFPISKRITSLTQYAYLGLRDISSSNFGLSYISKIISSLIEALIDDTNRIRELANTLKYLGYKDSISIRLEPRLTSRLANEFIESTNPIHIFEKIMRPGLFNSHVNRAFFYTESGKIDENKLEHLIKILKNFLYSPSSFLGSRKHINIELTSRGIHNKDLFDIPLDELLFLLHAGVLRLREVSLGKIGSTANYSISDASSGEQSVVMSILGIASQIRDGALICIDEPEICLHPEWQERYIKLLIDTFGGYKDCHFLIATHSPQIISKLEPENCFVLSMDDGIAVDAKDLINNSIDFQLANVFDSPGFNNEYLSRIGLSIFLKVNKRKSFDEKDSENFQTLISQEKFLSVEDPVYTLLVALKKLHKLYA